VGMLGWWMDRQMLEDNLLRQLGGVVGDKGTGVLRDALASAKEPSEGIAATVIGFGVLLFGATGVFGELQSAFERVWTQGRGTPAPQPFECAATRRLRVIGYILVCGFLLPVSLVISSRLRRFCARAGAWMPVDMLLRVLNEGATRLVCSA